MLYAGPIQDLIDELARMPGIGPKSAQRVAFYLLQATTEDAKRLANAIVEAKEKVRFCERCFNVSDQELCEYCRSTRRDRA
ncbi:MAG: recombination protein RecR, partial [Actinomycetota bacterium]